MAKTLVEKKGRNLDSINIKNVRKHLIGLEKKVPLLDGSEVQYVNFDNAASTPTFDFIYDKVGEYLEFYSNVHRGTGFKSMVSSWVYEKGREIVAEFINADLDKNVIIFTKNSTEALNKLARRYPFKRNDVVLTSLMEHHSNELPWRNRAFFDHVGLNEDGTLSIEDLKAKLKFYNGRVKLVAITGASNVTGYVNPIYDIAKMVHEAGAEILVDAAQIAPHRPIQMNNNGINDIDYLVISAHKMYAPFGVGVLVGSKNIFEIGDPSDVGGGVVDIVTLEEAYWADLPDKEEAGTPDIVGVVALTESIRMFQAIGWDDIIEHEAELTAHLLRRLQKIDKVIVYGDTDPANSQNRLGVVPFNMAGLSHALLAAILSYEGGIGVRNGCFCAHTYVKEILKVKAEEARKLEEEIKQRDRSHLPGTVRASFGIYNALEEVDRMCDLLEIISKDGHSGKYILNPEKGEYIPEGFKIDVTDYLKL
ncbi:MAG: aminotransferase class V-fold PLP-dependent enzyme [candidate division Zixibacteria bacterium]|nr:aminotransferase class V-fold PLP-dependent enzyme [candidate division Zixibacteria bacterium]